MKKWPALIETRPVVHRSRGISGGRSSPARRPDRESSDGGFAELLRTRSAAGRPLAILCLGIDHLGVINSSMGYEFGDRVIAAFANHLRRSVRRGTEVVRFSADRFLVLIGGWQKHDELEREIKRLRRRLNGCVRIAENRLDLTVSMGVSFFPDHGADANMLIRNADIALSRAREQGPAGRQFFAGDMARAVERVFSLQAKLRAAIDKGELVPYFQPQVDLDSGRIVGMEALVRWVSPELGVIPPGEFIPVAEEAGLIDDIGRLMLIQSARQNRDWQRQGLPRVPVAVNVSSRQLLTQGKLLRAVKKALKETELPPRFLEMELTESCSALVDPDSAIAAMKKIRALGIPCAIDDFGTGYSSLAVLKRFPIDCLKIDRSFIQDIESDSDALTIVEAIIAMAKAMRLRIVAEGVETAAQAILLRSLGCQVMQGYFFSRPLDAAAMGGLLAAEPGNPE